MKGKKKVLIGGGIASIIFIIILICIAMTPKDSKITISFDTDGGSSVETIKAKKGEKVSLPTTTKEGYTFEGWYDGSSKVRKNPSFKRDVTLKAHWLVEDAETMTFTFDTKGGNNVKEITIECNKSFTLPTPTKKGYKFLGWYNQDNVLISSKTKLTCEDIKLQAKWEKEAEEVKEEDIKEDKKEETKEEVKEEKKEYTCPTGYTLKVDKCTKEEDATLGCGEDKKEQDGKCVTISSSARKNPQISCGNDATGSQGTLVGNSCYYEEVAYPTEIDNTICTGDGHVWDSENNKCYSSKEDAIQACDSGYMSITNPGDNLTGGCFPVSDKEKTCSEGFTLKGDKCLKTIDATLK